MNWIENLLIITGATLDIFAAMECQGSLIAKINKKNLAAICAVIALAQLITLYLGHFLSSLFCRRHGVADEQLLGEIRGMYRCLCHRRNVHGVSHGIYRKDKSVCDWCNPVVDCGTGCTYTKSSGSTITPK